MMLGRCFSSLAVAGLLALSDATPLERRAVTTADAEAAYNALQQWYNTSIGLWIPSTGWWNSANCLTVVADLAAVDHNIERAANVVLERTYVRAQQYNLQMEKVQGTEAQPYLPHSYYGHHYPFFPPHWRHGRPQIQETSGFLNGCVSKIISVFMSADKRQLLR